MLSHLEPKKYGIALHTSSPQLGLALLHFAGDTRYQTWDLGRDLSTHLHQYLAEFIKPQIWADLAFIAVAKGPGGFTGTRIGVVTARTLAQQLDIPLFAISTLAAVAWSEAGRGTLSKQESWEAGEQGIVIHQFKTYIKLQSNVVDRGDEGDKEDKEDKEEKVLCTLAKRLRRSNATSVQNSKFKTLALQMPAQRGQLYTAIYQISNAASPLLPDAVMTPDTWKQILDDLAMPYQLLDVPMNLGISAMSVLELAYLDWQQGKRPHWSETLPFYGQHPVEDRG